MSCGHVAQIERLEKMVSSLQAENRELDKKNEKLYNELRKAKGARP